VALWEPRQHVEGDPLRGIEGGWHPGCCVAVLHSTEGKRKQLSGASAVEVLANLRSFLRWQETLKDDAPNKFVIAREELPAVEIVQRQGSEQAARDVVRRTLEFSTTGEVLASKDARR